jgi:hypothetical protein
MIDDKMLYNDILVTRPEPEQNGSCGLPPNLVVDEIYMTEHQKWWSMIALMKV